MEGWKIGIKEVGRKGMAAFFLLCTLHRACCKMKSAQRGFIFKKSNIHF